MKEPKLLSDAKKKLAKINMTLTEEQKKIVRGWKADPCFDLKDALDDLGQEIQDLVEFIETIEQWKASHERLLLMKEILKLIKEA